MKLFKNIKNWLENQEHLFYLFLFILIVPNLVLCLTEPLPLMAKVCNVLLPFGCYYLLMTLSRNCGKMLWILFLFLFFGAFQIVLLYLFGQSIIAVDMFLNLVTTNSSEALELLDNLTPAIIAVIILYVPALILGTISIVRKRKLTAEFIRRDLFENIKERYGMILSNPPYIRSAEIDTLQEEVRLHDPREALDGKEDGLYFYRRIVGESRRYLLPGGYLIFEIGYDQAEDVSALMRCAGYTGIQVKKDLAGLDRVVYGRYS